MADAVLVAGTVSGVLGFLLVVLLDRRRIGDELVRPSVQASQTFWARVRTDVLSIAAIVYGLTYSVIGASRVGQGIQDNEIGAEAVEGLGWILVALGAGAVGITRFVSHRLGHEYYRYPAASKLLGVGVLVQGVGEFVDGSTSRGAVSVGLGVILFGITSLDLQLARPASRALERGQQ